MDYFQSKDRIYIYNILVSHGGSGISNFYTYYRPKDEIENLVVKFGKTSH